MSVYMIQAGGNRGPVKLGYGDPQARLYDCQIGNHLELRLIRTFEGGADEELRLHELFSDLSIRGEWYGFSSAMLGDVGLVEISLEPAALVPIDPATIDIPQTPSAWADFGVKIRALRKSLGLTQAQVSTEVGIARNTLASIECGHDLPGRAALVRIASFYGVPLDLGGATS